MKTDFPIRDIHLPENASWWPIAPGWWLLFLISLFFLVLIYKKLKQQKIKYVSKYNNHPNIINKALKQLNNISQQTDDKQIIKQLSILLRRTAMSLYKNENVAGLTGNNWLYFLDNKGNTTEFSEGIGQALIAQPYQKKTDYPKKKLIKLTKKWLIIQKQATTQFSAQIIAQPSTKNNPTINKKRGRDHV